MWKMRGGGEVVGVCDESQAHRDAALKKTVVMRWVDSVFWTFFQVHLFLSVLCCHVRNYVRI